MKPTQIGIWNALGERYHDKWFHSLQNKHINNTVGSYKLI